MSCSMFRVMRAGLAGSAAIAAGVHLLTENPAEQTGFSGRFKLLAKSGNSLSTVSSPVNDLNMGHGTQWDYNWDKREPSSLLKPLKDSASEEDAQNYQKKLATLKPKASRVIVMVRHGQYNLEGKVDEERYLTDLGRKQAEKTGERLALLYKDYTATQDENGNIVKPRISLIKSTMTRATQTGDIVHSHFPGVDIRPCDMLREGGPCCPEPPVDFWNPEPFEFFEEGARIEAAFRKYFHRADPSQTETSVDILVCHGNVIRYCVCRALQLDPAAWLRMSVANGSITVFSISPSGRVKITTVGDAGHMPPDMISFT